MNKKSIRIISLALLVVLGGAMSVSAARWKRWKWRKYRIRFQLPSNFYIKETSSRKMVATDRRNFTMTITPWRNARLSARDVAYRAFRNYRAFTRKRILRQGRVRLINRAFKGHVILGTGYNRGRKVNFALVGIINPRSSVNFYVNFAWWHNTRHNRYYNRLAQNIAKTFTNMY